MIGVPALLGACARSEENDQQDGPDAATGARFVEFYGRRQTRIAPEVVPTLGMMASFKVLSPDPAALQDTFVDLTDEIEGLMSGRPPIIRDEAFPPTDSGILGGEPFPDNLAIVMSVGVSLFDDRYGLADKIPTELVRMPFLANDRLDPARTHGDLLLNIDADHPDTLQFALRQLMRRRRRDLVLHWLIEGCTRGGGPNSGGAGAPRNLLGFNPDSSWTQTHPCASAHFNVISGGQVSIHPGVNLARRRFLGHGLVKSPCQEHKLAPPHTPQTPIHEEWGLRTAPPTWTARSPRR